MLDGTLQMTMDRRRACLHQAELCLRRAEVEPARRAFWTAEARKWAARADEDLGPVAVVVERSTNQRHSGPGRGRRT